MRLIDQLRDELQAHTLSSSIAIREAALKRAPDVADEQLHTIYNLVDRKLDEVEVEALYSKTVAQIIADEIVSRGYIVPLMMGLPLVIGMIIGAVWGLSL